MRFVGLETTFVPGNFVCTNCEAYVQDPTAVIFTDTESGVDTHMPCPYCGEETLAEADRCECGNWKERSSSCCTKCKREAEDQLGIFLRSLLKSQVEYLDGIIEGTALEEYR